MFSILPKLSTHHLADAAVAHHQDARLTDNRLVKPYAMKAVDGLTIRVHIKFLALRHQSDGIPI